MERKKKRIPIVSIQQAGSAVAGRPGNLIVNQAGEAKPQNWFSNREFRNACLGKKLHPNLPLDFFVGATLEYEELTITAEDIAAGGGSVVVPLPGKDNLGQPRKATFKQAGVTNINLALNMDTLSAEKYMMMAELSMKFERRGAALGSGRSMAAAPASETITDDNVQNPAGTQLPNEGAGTTAIPPAGENAEQHVDEHAQATDLVNS